MCLDSITRIYDPPKEMTFYKVFARPKRGEWLETPVYDCKRKYRMGKSYKDEGIMDFFYLRASTCALSDDAFTFIQHHYRIGYHGFTAKRSAKSWSRPRSDLVIIKCRGLVRTVGMQDGRRAVVADTMTLLEEVKQ